MSEKIAYLKPTIASGVSKNIFPIVGGPIMGGPIFGRTVDAHPITKIKHIQERAHNDL